LTAPAKCELSIDLRLPAATFMSFVGGCHSLSAFGLSISITHLTLTKTKPFFSEHDLIDLCVPSLA